MASAGWTPMKRASTESVADSNTGVSFAEEARARSSTQSTSSHRNRNSDQPSRGHRQKHHSTKQRPLGTKRRVSEHIQKALSQISMYEDSEESSTDDEYLVTGVRRLPSQGVLGVEQQRLITNSAYFKTTTGVIIMLNTVVIALEAVYVQQQYHVFDILETTFTLFYAVEIAWRLRDKGIVDFLSKDDFWWNWFDLVITGLSLTDTFMEAFTEASSSGASVTRLFRVFRILRMFRAMRFLSEVDYVLAHAAMATIKLGAVVSIVLFVASIIATNMLWDCQDAIVANMFSDLGMSMWSMFKLMTLDDWIPVSERVIKVKPGMIVFFIVFIFCTSIALISLVPAIFIEISLNSKTRQEKLDSERQNLQARRQKMRLLRTLFKLTDRNANGKISVSEMKRVLEDDTYFRRLQEAGLTDAGDLRDIRLGLFDLWEETFEETARQDSEITEEDFTSGILRVHEEVSQAVLWRCTTSTRLMLRDFSHVVQKELRDIRENTSKLESNMSRLFDRLKPGAELEHAGSGLSSLPRTSSSATILGGAINAASLRDSETGYMSRVSSDAGLNSYQVRSPRTRVSVVSELESMCKIDSMASVPEDAEIDSSWYPQHVVTTERMGFSDGSDRGSSGEEEMEKDYIPPDVAGSGMMFEQYDSSEPLLSKAKVTPLEQVVRFSAREGATRVPSRDASLSPRQRMLL